MIDIKTFTFNPFQEMGSIIWDETLEGVLIDPGCYDEGDFSKIENLVSEKHIKLVGIWLTHGHFDHIYGVKKLSSKYGLPVYMHPDDKIMVEKSSLFATAFSLNTPDSSFETKDIHDGDVLSFGNTLFSVIGTPGHTAGSVCFYDEKDKVLFTGDTLFAGSIGRTDLPGGDYDKLIVSVMDKIMGLDGDVAVIPGHGPSTDIGYERTHNPFLEPFNEPDDNYEFDPEN